MAFDSDDLLERLQALTTGFDVSRWLVAFSGGIDSSVLLHALARSGTDKPVQVVHIDHGLHAESAGWAAHCKASAEALDVSYLGIEVAVAGDTGSGPEAAARQARYAALLGVVMDGDCLLSAHHENDQAETLLLNLMRGSGPAGLAGIGARQSFGKGLLLRPLLGVSGEMIGEYAERHDLSWLNDPSNVDTRFDRNFLRREVLPGLTSRWPAVSNRLRRSAELVGEASELLNELADIDLETCGSLERLDIAALQGLSQPRQRNLLRRVVRLSGLPPPPATRAHQVIHELIPARADAQPLVTWKGVEVRRYRANLYVMPTLDTATASPKQRLRPGMNGVSLGKGLGSIHLIDDGGAGIDPSVAAEGLRVEFRDGGEEIRIAGDGATRKLKKLMQEAGVLPWMRERVPLLYSGARIVAVGDLWIAAECAAEPGLVVRWTDKPAIREPAAL